MLYPNPFEEYGEMLTPRQREVFVLQLQGMDLRQIAQRLGISYRTAKNHSSIVKQKLGGRAQEWLAVNYCGRSSCRQRVGAGAAVTTRCVASSSASPSCELPVASAPKRK